MKKILFILAAAIGLIIVSYADHAHEMSTALSDEQDAVPVFNYSSEKEEVPKQTYSSLDERLVNTSEADGYIVEKYQEFEVYKDSKGNVVKSVPTSNYNYLRYKKDE
ncbi:hypothetical protein [Metabacillus sp. RGM 3146]|uniref:hypothetical protein n=1 Tax=Metabacillus sp. RGM 3146 TaxID=3401092 RepID=UPI003B9AF85F